MRIKSVIFSVYFYEAVVCDRATRLNASLSRLFFLRVNDRYFRVYYG